MVILLGTYPVHRGNHHQGNQGDGSDGINGAVSLYFHFHFSIPPFTQTETVVQVNQTLQIMSNQQWFGQDQSIMQEITTVAIKNIMFTAKQFFPIHRTKTKLLVIL